MYIVVIAVVLACAPLLFHWMHNSTNVFFPTVHDLVSTVLPSSTTPTLSVAGSRPGITDDASQKSELASVSGVYVVSRILRRTADNLPDSVYESPDIDGVVISAPWNDIEPSPGVYDWTLVDTEIKRAVANGKKITIAIHTGVWTPSWLFAAPYNVAHDTFYFSSSNGADGKPCTAYTMPAPWDSTYESQYAQVVQAYANHLKSIPGAYDAVTRVKLSGINTISVELHLGYCSNSDGLSRWQTLGYTPDKLIAAAKALAGSVNQAFPDKVLSLDILVENALPTINNSGQVVTKTSPTFVDVTQSLIRYFGTPSSGFNNRFAVQWDGFSSTQNAAFTQSVAEARELGIILGGGTNNFGGKGAIGCGLKAAPTECDDTQFQSILDGIISEGGAYIEISSAASVSQFPDAIAEAQARLTALFGK